MSLRRLLALLGLLILCKGRKLQQLSDRLPARCGFHLSGWFSRKTTNCWMSEWIKVEHEEGRLSSNRLFTGVSICQESDGLFVSGPLPDLWPQPHYSTGSCNQRLAPWRRRWWRDEAFFYSSLILLRPPSHLYVLLVEQEMPPEAQRFSKCLSHLEQQIIQQTQRRWCSCLPAGCWWLRQLTRVTQDSKMFGLDPILLLRLGLTQQSV